jgi:nicotinate-nucleotide pyrophosphorylase (carboxylating)
MTFFPFANGTRQLIRLALGEYLVGGDVTTDAIFSLNDQICTTFVAKEPMVLAGIPMAHAVLQEIDPSVVLVWTAADGDPLGVGPFGTMSGPTISVLRAERVILNFMRHLSGVATLTRRCVDALGEGGPALVDTRKTTPGYRELEKYAVRMGGGKNHRFNLAGGAMIKDNHIAAAGSITRAVEKVRAHAPFLIRIEVEVTNRVELDEALAAGADAVMLDNMSTEDMRRECAHIAGRAIVEASGNITIERLAELRDVGLDVISSGALTHSAPNADISLRVLPA